MNHLRLTILLEPGLSKSDLANTFGNFKEINKTNRYVQFAFKNITLLNVVQLRPINALLRSFEQKKSLMHVLMHLADENDQRPSPNYIMCIRGKWELIETNTNITKKVGNSIDKIIS